MLKCAPARHLLRRQGFYQRLSSTNAERKVLDTSSDEYQFLEKSTLPSYHFQKSLPRLPIPELSKTCDRYLKAQTPLLTPEEHAELVKLTKDFETGVGKGLDERLRTRDSNNKHTNHISETWFDMYLASRDSIPINYNPGLVFIDAPGSQTTRAANLVISALRFMKSLRAEVLSPEVFHLNPAKSDTSLFRNATRLLPSSVSWYGAYLFNAYPLDMSQYASLFNSTRIPKRDKDILRRDESGRHLVVMKNGRFYKVDVLDKNGNIYAPETIKACIDQITSRGDSPSPHPIGVLTTKRRDEWAAIHEHLTSLPGNAQAIKDIDSAIFVLCLDDVKGKEDPVETVRLCIHSDGVNRWFDKSFNLIVAADGKAGLNFEHSWGDGVAILRFAQDIIRDNAKYQFVNDNTKSNADVANLVKEIEFTVDTRLEDAIKKTEAEYKSTCSQLALNAVRGEGFGKKTCKAGKVSPDSVMQLAMQVAYHKVFNGFVATYESCSTAAFKHGRTETVRPNTVATRDFALLFNRSSQPPQEELKLKMQECSAMHNQLTKEAAMGNGFDRHLFALKHLALSTGNLPDFFKHPAYAKINHNILSTSTLPSLEIESGGFGPVVSDGFGVGYFILDQQWGCGVSSYPKTRDGASFAAAFEETIQQFTKLLK